MNMFPINILKQNKQIQGKTLDETYLNFWLEKMDKHTKATRSSNVCSIIAFHLNLHVTKKITTQIKAQ